VADWREMKLLLDTNIFLEIILEQDKTEDAKALLESAGENELFISDYSLHYMFGALGSDPANCLIYQRKIGIKGVV
jgi:predicted nucleic acid-binding protein